ncbi:hypothetical protein SAV14893_014450 [Streptomyces avermitilis]|uniref:Uncharacterized protein n=1 Tax=Streptomyces avermitilis TaxID=33903 RepID=A0A4D4LL14_STRAX|nr:hypothetical protein SAV14893_014450 [Streptomyces avermitilis]GDY77843.1 hypothetical protein SAV31267_073280 [Streptomyces avermitilis]
MLVYVQAHPGEDAEALAECEWHARPLSSRTEYPENARAWQRAADLSEPIRRFVDPTGPARTG